jgi:dethiobiotin synthetase
MGAQFLICGTGPRTGKTMTACALAFAFKVRGLRVGVMKPIATGCAAKDGMVRLDDAEALAAAASSDLLLKRISPFRYKTEAPPMPAAIADGMLPPDYAAIANGLRAIQANNDVIIVEEAWGLDAMIGESHDYASLAADCALELILVAARRDGFMAETARILDHAERHHLPVRGMIFNCLAPALLVDIAEDAARLAQAVRVPLLGIVRYKEPLSLAIVRNLL